MNRVDIKRTMQNGKIHHSFRQEASSFKARRNARSYMLDLVVSYRKNLTFRPNCRIIQSIRWTDMFSITAW